MGELRGGVAPLFSGSLGAKREKGNGGRRGGIDSAVPRITPPPRPKQKHRDQSYPPSHRVNDDRPREIVKLGADAALSQA